jgi:hypothetical protein
MLPDHISKSLRGSVPHILYDSTLAKKSRVALDKHFHTPQLMKLADIVNKGVKNGCQETAILDNSTFVWQFSVVLKIIYLHTSLFLHLNLLSQDQLKLSFYKLGRR